MGMIHVLDDAVINKIAAGEVVERPASVVKELVENAIDAGSNQITVELVDGGHKRITVTDNGSGMTEEDAKLALTRHSTSKISTADDLFSIQSMGFRGEALASISAVSKFSLSTVRKGAESGHKLRFEGQGSPNVTSWNGPDGTSISVESLFFNVPVREKFLKSAGTEYSHCLEYLQSMALVHPEIGFSLIHNKREQFRCAAVVTAEELTQRENASGYIGEDVVRQRVSDVIGTEACEKLLYLIEENQYGRVEALISPPGVEKPTGKHIVSFVNKRWVKDKTVRYGVMRGYHSHLLKGKYPRAITFLTVDSSIVDVNVHPAKTEMRFQYPGEVQGLIALGIRKRIRQGDWATHLDPLPVNETVTHSSPFAPAGEGRPSIAQSFGAQSSEGGFSSSVKRSTLSFDGSSRTGAATPAGRTTQNTRFESIGALGGGAAETGFPPIEIKQETVKIDWQNLNYIGTFSRCYLFFEWEDKLLVVDQHAFHERIIFERLMKDRSILDQVQKMMIPEALELSIEEVEKLRSRQKEISGMGLEFEVIGDTTVEVSSVPYLLAGKDLAAVMSSLADELLHGAADQNTDELSMIPLATIACHSAVRSGETLGENELTALMQEAEEVDFYHNCPHGRRVLRVFSNHNIASWFDRV